MAIARKQLDRVGGHDEGILQGIFDLIARVEGVSNGLGVGSKAGMKVGGIRWMRGI